MGFYGGRARGQEFPRAAVPQSSNSHEPPAPVSPFRRAEDLLKALSSGLLGMQREGGRTLTEEGGTPKSFVLTPASPAKARLSQPPTKAGSGHFTSGPQVALGSWDIGNAQRGGPGRSGWSACSVVTPPFSVVGSRGSGSPLTLCAQRWPGLWSPGLLCGLLSWLPAGSQAVRSLAGGWRWGGLQRHWTVGVLGGSHGVGG